MSGVGCALAGSAAATGGGGGTPLGASVSFSGGTGPFNVAGASSDLYTQGSSVISVSVSGGTPPYSESVSIQGDPSGKISIVAASDHIHNTVGYSGFSVNETEIFYIQYHVTDSASGSATVRYPANPATAASIKRTS